MWFYSVSCVPSHLSPLRRHSRAFFQIAVMHWGTGPLLPLPYTPTYAHINTHTLFYSLLVGCVWRVICPQSERLTYCSVQHCTVTAVLYSDSDVLYITETVLLYNTVPVEWVEVTIYEEEPATEDRITESLCFNSSFALPSLSLKFVSSWNHSLLLNTFMSAWLCSSSLHSLPLVYWSVRFTCMIDDEKAKENCVNEEDDGTYCDHQHSTTSTLDCSAWLDYLDVCRGMLSAELCDRCWVSDGRCSDLWYI